MIELGGGNFTERGPTGHCRRPTSQHSERNRELMVNLDVNAYTKTQNNRKIVWKTQKQQPTENQTN